MSSNKTQTREDDDTDRPPPSILTSFRNVRNRLSLSLPNLPRASSFGISSSSLTNSKLRPQKKTSFDSNIPHSQLPQPPNEFDKAFGTINDKIPPSWPRIRSFLSSLPSSSQSQSHSHSSSGSNLNNRNNSSNPNNLTSALFTKGHDQRTILHWSLRHNAPPDILNILIHHGGRRLVRSSDKHGCIPLHEACFKGNPSGIVQILVEVGGDDSVSEYSAWGTTPLHSACFGAACSRETVEFLLERGGEQAVHSRNNQGNTPLHLVCDGGSGGGRDISGVLDVLELLIEKGGAASLEAENGDGHTPLHYACLHNAAVEVFELLMEKRHELGTTAAAGAGTNAISNENRGCSTEGIPDKTITAIMEWVQMQNGTSSKSGLIRSPFLQKILNDMFVYPRYLTVLMIDFYTQVMLVVLFSFGINDAVREEVPISTFLAVLIGLGISWHVVRDLLQMATTPLKEYVIDGTEFLDWIQIWLVCWSLRILTLEQANIPHDDPHRSIVLTTVTGLSWILLIYVLGDFFSPIAVFVAALRRIVFKLIPLIVTTLLMVFGFAHMFYISSIASGNCTENADNSSSSVTITEDNWTCDVSASYFMALSMALEGEHQFLMGSPVRLTEMTLENAVSILFGLFIGILLLNILIALVSNVFSEVSEKSTEEFWSNRYASMFELNRIYEGIKHGIKALKNRKDSGGSASSTMKVPPSVLRKTGTSTLRTNSTLEVKESEYEGEEGETREFLSPMQAYLLATRCATSSNHMQIEQRESIEDTEEEKEEEVEVEEDKKRVSQEGGSSGDVKGRFTRRSSKRSSRFVTTDVPISTINIEESDGEAHNLKEDDGSRGSGELEQIIASSSPAHATTRYVEDESEVFTDSKDDASDTKVTSTNLSENNDSDEAEVKTSDAGAISPPPPKIQSPLPERFDFTTTLVKSTFFTLYHEFPDEERQFLAWWTGISPAPISLRRRCKYFFQRSVLGEIVIPGKVFEKVLRGTYEKQLLAQIIARFMTYLIFAVVPIVLLGLFLLGLVTLGLLWPRWLREFLFYGSIEMGKTAKEDLEEVKATMKDLISEIAELKAVVNQSKEILLDRSPAERK